MKRSLFVCVLLTGCPATPDCPDGTYADAAGDCVSNVLPIPAPTSGNNWAILAGAAVPDAAAGDPTLYRRLPVEVTGLAYGFEVGEAMLVDTGSSVRTVIPVTNTGRFAQCFVQTSELSFLDTSGVVQVSEALSFVQGTVHALSSGVITDTCLDASQTGYLLDVLSGTSLDGLSSVRLGFEEPRTDLTAIFTTVVQPSEYAEPSAGELEIVATHVEGDGAVLSDLLTYVLFDDADRPLWWGTLDGQPPSGMDPGGSRSYTRTIESPTAGSTLWGYVDFLDQARSQAPASLMGDELERWRLDRRNAEAARLNAL